MRRILTLGSLVALVAVSAAASRPPQHRDGATVAASVTTAPAIVLDTVTLAFPAPTPLTQSVASLASAPLAADRDSVQPRALTARWRPSSVMPLQYNDSTIHDPGWRQDSAVTRS